MHLIQKNSFQAFDPLLLTCILTMGKTVVSSELYEKYKFGRHCGLNGILIVHSVPEVLPHARVSVDSRSIDRDGCLDAYI